MKDKLHEYIKSIKTDIQKEKLLDKYEQENQNSLIENEINRMKLDNKTVQSEINKYKTYIKSIDRNNLKVNINKVEIKKPNLFQRLINYLKKKFTND